MTNYPYQNTLINKQQLRQILAWSFTNCHSMQACLLADELKYLGFQYATQAGLSISVEDLKVPFVKTLMLQKANQEIKDVDKVYFKGCATDVERLQKIISTWSLTSESLKDQILYFFKNYDPLNSVYIMAFSGARGNLSQVRQLVGLRGLMSDPSGEIINLPIKKNFREGLTVTDYLMSGYGARKGIIDTALKTANSGYLTRRLIDVAQDIIIREKDCLTKYSSLIVTKKNTFVDLKKTFDPLLGRVLSKPVVFSSFFYKKFNSQITTTLVNELKKINVNSIYIRSPLTCTLYRAICQMCYGWDLSHENLVDIGEAVGILAGQSIGEPGTQLTMRTFHTGGIFTSEVKQQISSPTDGIIRFRKTLKTSLLRTNRGEDVFVTKTAGSLILLPKKTYLRLILLKIPRNTILFPKNNQYILKNMVIGEIISTNQQIKREIKPIFSNISGEIFIPSLKKKINIQKQNKLIWLLSGQLYYAPTNFFLNFYNDYKINRNNFVFRTKLTLQSNKTIFNFQLTKGIEDKNILGSGKLQKLKTIVKTRNHILNLEKFKFLITIQTTQRYNYLKTTKNVQIGSLATNSFKTLTGGIVFYDCQNLLKTNFSNKAISYFYFLSTKLKYNKRIFCNTLSWLNEEAIQIDNEFINKTIETGNFLSKKFPLTKNFFSKTPGIILLKQKVAGKKIVIIKSGLAYHGKRLKCLSTKIYYPGEKVFCNIVAKTLVFCELINYKKKIYLLVRPLKLYEIPFSQNRIFQKNNIQNNATVSPFCLKKICLYKSAQKIRCCKNIDLILTLLKWDQNVSQISFLSLKILNNIVKIQTIKNLRLTNQLTSHLKYQKINSCKLVQKQKNQFLSKYSIVGYLESTIKRSLEIVKLKIKKAKESQIMLISNIDCLSINKTNVSTPRLKNFIRNCTQINSIGKLLIENESFVTIQKGQPYFFPNCKNTNFAFKPKLEYKILPAHRFKSNFKKLKVFSPSYYNIAQISIQKSFSQNLLLRHKTTSFIHFSEFFFKSQGRFYNSLIPQLFQKFSVNKNFFLLDFNKLIGFKSFKNSIFRKPSRTILIRSFGTTMNLSKNSIPPAYQLIMFTFVEQPFKRSTKSVGIYSITGDYYEQETNKIFCKNKEFVESDTTIGFLNLEKKITEDIVQGLPRIEEILEARKKKIFLKKLSSSKKESQLIQKTNLDSNFEFKKIGVTVGDNEKVNPHGLLKTYFNYFGSFKTFFCGQTKTVHAVRLSENYEGSYKSFKKVQLFMLRSVQYIYQSQGVKINDKHLEIIIKQMTTKVLITDEGKTPLLRKEVVDLYHIQCINKIIKYKKKKGATYVPLLLGITKAALNNPSFISAASFQETTKVLTKATIEGQIDWLRGLKENIAVGHLMPAGTGSQNYLNSF